MKSLTIYGRECFKLLADDLQKDVVAQPELFHKIRLEIKKIKALIRVTGFCVEGFKMRKHYLPFRSIFRKAGEVRQADVLDRLLRARKIDRARITHQEIHSGMGSLILDFENELPQLLSSVKNNRRKLIEVFKMVKRGCFEKYLNNQKKELKKKLYPNLTQHELHKTRKALKEVLYLSAISKKSKKKLNSFYETLQVLIGQWHDKQTVIVFLKADNNSEEIERLGAECRNDIENIVDLVSGFYGSR